MRGIGTRVVALSPLALVAALAGCHSAQSRKDASAPRPYPKELNKVNLPEYRVEPPDILLIEAVRAIPKPPYRAEPLDVLFIDLTNPIPNEPLTGLLTVEPDGTVNLGVAYRGYVSVVGKTIPEIEAAIEKHLVAVVKLKDPKVSVSLSQGRAGQRISGPHLIQPDGFISLGTYGRVPVTGLTLAEAKAAIEAHLSNYLLNPEVSVDVQGFNSKTYYVVLDGGGAGQTVVRLPVTGNETVIDAISQVNGLTAVSSQNRIWVSRPRPDGGCETLPVNWRAVVEAGNPGTNYQLFPGDRVYVAAYPVTAFDTRLARIFAPVERVLGITLLGTGVYTGIQQAGQPLGGFGGGGFFP